VCLTQLSSSAVVARAKLSYIVNCAAALPDDRLAVCGRRGNAALIGAPAAAADVVKAHDAAVIPDAGEDVSAPAIPEPLPPLQDAVVRVAAGVLTAAAACRDLISADACSASLAEWSAGHLLLMQAIRDDEIPGDRRYDGIDFYWVKNLYLPTRLLVLGHGNDYSTVERLLLQAEAAGVIQSADAVVAAMATHIDLRDNLNEFRSAGEQILRAIAHIFMRQADVEQRLCDLENGFERFKRVQQWTQLANIVFSLVPFAGGSIACGIACAAPAFEGMQISNMVESLIGVATGSQAVATAPLFNRFFSCGNDLLSDDGLAVMPDDAMFLLEKVATELGVSVQGLQQILKETAQRMLEDENGGAPAGTVEDSEDVYREAVTFLLDVEVRGTGARRFATVLNLLKEHGVTAALVSKMRHDELAVSLAAYMVIYEELRLPLFVKLRRCLVDIFMELPVSGSLLVGEYAISADHFFELVVEGLTSSNVFWSMAGHKSTLRRFIHLVYGERLA
jgi:hypothetical protein